MAVEHAGIHAVRKPWGSSDLLPWSGIQDAGSAIGELWFQRTDPCAPVSSLLLKLLFTTEPLSVQVHPDDAYAHAIGLANGKTEAWYILSAAPDAKIAIGLKRRLTAAQLRASIEDGSISQLVHWQPVAKDDVIFVPAGTIHAIGAGLVLAEIQQRSDTTFRLFDYGRARPLHVDDAVAVAMAQPSEPQPVPQRLTDARAVLLANPYFVLERIDLPPGSRWALAAERETWMLVLAGHARAGPINAFVGDAVFVQADRAVLEVGIDGMTGLLAYVGPDPCPGLLQNLDDPSAAILRSPLHQTANLRSPVSTTEAAS
jgi:mannose-6-phosphate isomerase